MARLAAIVRHPIKAVGREELTSVDLTADDPLPWDRVWAVAHADAKFGSAPEVWAHKMNFLRGVSGPELMAVAAQYHDSTGQMTLTHPARPAITFDPADDAAFLDWIRPLWPEDKAPPAALVQVPGVAMTDVPEPWVSINSHASLADLSRRMGANLSMHRWRGNLWLDDIAPWAEFDWIGRDIRIGSVTLRIEERITRCKATMANPETGQRDADTLGALEAQYGHQDFGVYARVTRGGRIAVGDPVQ